MRVETGGTVSGAVDRPAYTLRVPHSSPLPVLIAVPHGGRDYPSALLSQMRDPDYACLRLEDRLIDLLGGKIADRTGAALLVAHAPRAMLDLNRARDDIDWSMVSGTKPHPVRHSQANRRARSGLGLVPRRLPGFGEIWRSPLDRSELEQRIERIHRPYHLACASELARIRDQWGAALLLDLHSMPPLRSAQGEAQPARFVLGDRFGTSCSAGLAARGYGMLEKSTGAVAHNRPYAGGYVLDTHAAPARGIHAIQLEVCRSTYLDDAFNEVSDGIEELADMLADLVRELGAAVADMGGAIDLPQAAE